MDRNPEHLYEFGPFRVDAHQRLLYRDGKVVPLTLRAFDMLLALVENHGRVLTKEQLMERVWPDSFVEEANLSHNIYKLREALGQKQNGVKYIETLPRRGYRFVGPVSEILDEGVDLFLEEQTRTSVVIEEETRRIETYDEALTCADDVTVVRRQGNAKKIKGLLRPAALIGGCMILFGLALATYLLLTRNDAQLGARHGSIHSLAVLPFRPLSAESRDESLEFGMADNLIYRLGSLSELTVRPISAVRKYTDLQQDALMAGRDLAVDSVLDGTIQKRGDRLRITARLFSVKDDRPLWAEKYDLQFDDIFKVEDSIAEKIAGSLALKLTNEEKDSLKKRYTQNTDAYQAYLIGRYHWNKRTPGGLMASIKYFDQAIEKDPSYALAYAGIADTYLLLPEFTGTRFDLYFDKAAAATSKALELDDSLAEAHNSLAYMRQINSEWSSAEQEYKRAIELNPNYATAHQWYSELLCERGRASESDQEIERARQLDPLSLIINTRIGINLYMERDYDRAIQKLKTARSGKRFRTCALFPLYDLCTEGYVPRRYTAGSCRLVRESSPGRKAQHRWYV